MKKNAGMYVASTPLGVLRETQGLEAEKRHILDALRDTGGNVRRAAVWLGIDRTYLYFRIWFLGIEDDLKKIREAARKPSAWVQRTNEELLK